MTREPDTKAGRKEAKNAKRLTRLAQELRANLLKRKAKAKAKELPRDRNEGRQS